MAPKWHSVSPWGAVDRKLSKDAIVLRDYLDRSPTRASEGLFPLSLGYAAVDTPLTDAEIKDAMAELSVAGLYEYDEETEVALDLNALWLNPIRDARDNRIKSAVRIFTSIPDTPLKERFMALADQHSKPLADVIREDLARTYEGPTKDRVEAFSDESKSVEAWSGESEESADARVHVQDDGSVW